MGEEGGLTRDLREAPKASATESVTLSNDALMAGWS